MPIKLAFMVFKDISKYGGRLFRFYFIKDGIKGELMTRSYMGFLEELHNACGDTLVVVERVYKFNRRSKKEWTYLTAEEQVAYIVNLVVGYNATNPFKVEITHHSGMPLYLQKDLPWYFSMLGIPYRDYYTVSFFWVGAPTKEAGDKVCSVRELLKNKKFVCSKESIGFKLYELVKTLSWVK